MLIGALAMAAFLISRSLLIRSGKNPAMSGLVAGLFVATAAIAAWAASFSLHAPQHASPAPVEVEPTVKIPGVAIHSRRIPISRSALQRLARSPDALAIGYIDSVNGINADHSGGRLRFPLGAPMFVKGWAGEPSRKPGAALILIVDSTERIDATKFYDKRRLDVAAAFGTRAMEFSGFEGVRIVTAGLSRGSHKIEIGVVGADRRYYYLVRQIRTVELY